MMTSFRVFSGLILVLLACTGCMRFNHAPASKPAPPEPRLHELSMYLSSVLEAGRLPPCSSATGDWAPFLSPDHGAVSDYRNWITDIRDYNRRLEAMQEYLPFPIVRELKDAPLAAPYRAEQWMRVLDTAPAGVNGAFQQADYLLNAFPEAAVQRQYPVIPPNEAVNDSPDLLAEIITQVIQAARIVDQEALGELSQEQRVLMQFILPWICRTNGRFIGQSQGAVPYNMYWTFAPAEPFEPGAASTPESAIPIPDALHSMTGIYHYLRASAGAPIVTSGIVQDYKHTGSQHPQFVESVDYTAMQRALKLLSEALTHDRLVKLAAALRTRPPTTATVPGVSGSILHTEETAYGRIIIGGPDTNRYEDVDALLIIDAGGDDYYLDSTPQTRIGLRPLQVIIDCQGSDLYWVGANGVGGPAAGILGIGLLIDLMGDDMYCQGLAESYKPRDQTVQSLVQPDPAATDTQHVALDLLYGPDASPEAPGVALNAGFTYGAGMLGIGLLIDNDGDDMYLGQKHCFGSGMWRGIGLLHDTNGDDVYVAGVAAVGSAVNLSFGRIDDRSGNDHYQVLGHHESGYSAGRDWDNGYSCGGIGYGASWRAEARYDDEEHRWQATFGAGFGMVHDALGNDSYIGSSFGVASGYAGGIGSLIDDNGNDTYFVKRGPNGSNRSGWSGNHALANGCHRGIGYLLDRAGDDRYSASTLGGGTAWDIGMGYLLDLGGNDHMTDLHGVNFRGNTGWAGAKALAVSAHWDGTDHYERASFGNASAIAEGYPGKGGNFAFFVDAGDHDDSYTGDKFSNDICRPGAVSWEETDSNVKNPAGIGIFTDGSAWSDR